jgi:hypothetical protein
MFDNVNLLKWDKVTPERTQYAPNFKNQALCPLKLTKLQNKVLFWLADEICRFSFQTSNLGDFVFGVSHMKVPEGKN